MTDTCDPGLPWPMGMHLRDGGANFALYSSAAEAVELCLFDAEGREELRRIRLPARTEDIWHGFVPGLEPGTRYGVRVLGPFDPGNGQRCNPAKLLLDPYTRAIDRPLRGDAVTFGYPLGHEEQDLARDDSDSAAVAAKSVVIAPDFDWQGDRPPAVPMADSIFYEVNVRGFTKSMPGVPEELRGTFAGLANQAAVDYLKRLGVTAVQLLPVQAFNDEGRLVDAGLANFWGYNTIGFFAPEPRYCFKGTDGGVAEFRGMVKALHQAGIEVILDVVYNHTCEGNHLGPTMCFKGIDNAAYYRLTEDRRYYNDFSGTGNTLDVSNPPVLRMVMDSLRYWVEEMHVDGFRFDLAPAISRDAAGAFDHRTPFLSAVAQDPVLRRVKMIAEPWDLGDYGYQVGGFPVGWSEWNGSYRDEVRDFWRNADDSLPTFASRLCGTPEIFAPSRRPPSASVNIVTVHDGFTLRDLVSYNEKHNEANGEDNRDGESHNRSWNCGAEGPTEDAGVLALRARQQRNLLATLFMSRGVPLLLGGDEIGRTQQGNNNAYCQDSPISWFDWSDGARDDALFAFTAKLIRLRKELAVLRSPHWPVGDGEHPDATWYSVWGLPMTEDEWQHPGARCLQLVFDGAADHAKGRATQPGPSVLLLFNGAPEAHLFTVPPETRFGPAWQLRIATDRAQLPARRARRIAPGAKLRLKAHAMMVLTQGPGG
ncbi:MAG: glycogen debranching enzyme GlgX [Variovorax paradoxus]|nr:MAG: glycogen debranching enzyme GlgX [Variovorax paradoxus]PZQ06197.1 MAG: glycogen debranching enzyme GlgX [Variovorax paradoxus]